MSHPVRVATVLVAVALGSAASVAAATGAFAKTHASPSDTRKTMTIRVGPGAVGRTIRAHGYGLVLRLTPNRATANARTAVSLTRAGQAVNGARIHVTFTMLDMSMGSVTRLLRAGGTGRYSDGGPILMFGRWSLRIAIAPRHGAPFAVHVVDRVGI